MSETRVVVTGIGVVTPIGTGKDKFWEAAVKGTNGVLPIESIDTSAHKTKTGGEVRDFEPESYLSEKEISAMGRSSQFALASARMAVKDANLDLSLYDPFRIGISMGTTMGEPQILDQSMTLKFENDNNEDAIPEDLPKQYPGGVITANIARGIGAKGPATLIPTACAAGNYAIGYAVDQIRLGKIDMAFAGGSDPFAGIAFTGFNRLLATTSSVCKPFDKDREGMAVSEGAAVLVLETLESAQNRGAKIYAEILGYGLACDAFKMTIPAPDGIGGILAFKNALKNTGVTPEEVDYISVHGTGTGENDKGETIIIKDVLGEEKAYKTPVSSLKSMLGHTMGAASAIEAAACALMIDNGKILPTINYETPDPLCDLDVVPNEARDADLDTVVSLAYGFAGNTSALVLKKYKG